MSGTVGADVVIIGAGPAGISAAVWCRDLGLPVTLLERGSEVGGQLHSIYNPIDNYPGRRARNGEEMLVHFRASLDHFRISARLNAGVTAIDTARSEITLTSDERITYGALIIATGVGRRTLDVPGELEFRGKGVIESGARDKGTLSGKRVVIVGGGDAAAENALMISEFAERVVLVHRRPNLTARSDFQDEIRRRSNIELLSGHRLTAIEGSSVVEKVTLAKTAGNSQHLVEADAVLIRIGVEPTSSVVRGIVDLDERDYIRVGPNGQTSVPRIFAVGDVANPMSPTLSTAVGSGASAAKAHLRWRNRQ